MVKLRFLETSLAVFNKMYVKTIKLTNLHAKFNRIYCQKKVDHDRIISMLFHSNTTFESYKQTSGETTHYCQKITH